MTNVSRIFPFRCVLFCLFFSSMLALRRVRPGTNWIRDVRESLCRRQSTIKLFKIRVFALLDVIENTTDRLEPLIRFFRVNFQGFLSPLDRQDTYTFLKIRSIFSTSLSKLFYSFITRILRSTWTNHLIVFFASFYQVLPSSPTLISLNLGFFSL